MIASGKPFSPSATAIKTSSTPRFFSSFMTRSQNLAPSFCSSHEPQAKNFLGAVGAHAERDVRRLVADQPLTPAHFEVPTYVTLACSASLWDVEWLTGSLAENGNGYFITTIPTARNQGSPCYSK
jgi:hypothetical protein